MRTTDRRDPQQFLRQAQASERTRGHLRIFLGFAAGVGKTYAMLQAARQRRQEGTQVLIGYVEAHGRAETENLLEGLEAAPLLELDYHGVRLTELNLDWLLQHRPSLVLVDELAHTNAPGLRHPKRYQDVEELLDAGIDVYTTLNVQHIESLNDAVETITGVRVRETLPDAVVAEADEISLVDVPPEELLKRLKAGKIYEQEQALRAAQSFFRPGNLTALREMALRTAASQVEEDMLEYMEHRSIAGPWPASERLLVCVGPSPLSERLVRAAKRLATALDAEWYAVSVELTGSPLDEAGQERLHKHLRLAESLQAKTVSLRGSSLPAAIMEFARGHNVTKIVIGKPIKPWWQEIGRRSPVDQLIRESGAVDVYVINSQTSAVPPPHKRPRLSLSGLPGALLWVSVVTVLCYPLSHAIAPPNLVMAYLCEVVAVAYYLGRDAAIWSSILSVVAFDFCYIPPTLTFRVSDPEHLLTFLGLFLVGLTVSNLTARAREEAESAALREQQTASLFELSRQLGRAKTSDEIRQVATDALSKRVGQSWLLYAENHALIYPAALSNGDRAVAEWCWMNQKPAGAGTDTLGGTPYHWRPVTHLAVLGISQPPVSPIQREYLETVVNLVGIALERHNWSQEAQRAGALEAAERLQRALLNSISHDLRIPLVSITGALSSLNEDQGLQEDAQILVDNALNESERLNRLVGNLLQMSRIEAGIMQVKKEPCDLQDLIGSSLEAAQSVSSHHAVEVKLEEPLPLVSLDFVLMQQVLLNLVDNACKFTPTGGRIELGARAGKGSVDLWIADSGPGIPHDNRQLVFQRFFRQGSQGSGLGLSICQGIVEAHDGQIWAEESQSGGCKMTVRLPV